MFYSNGYNRIIEYPEHFQDASKSHHKKTYSSAPEHIETFRRTCNASNQKTLSLPFAQKTVHSNLNKNWNACDIKKLIFGMPVAILNRHFYFYRYYSPEPDLIYS